MTYEYKIDFLRRDVTGCALRHQNWWSKTLNKTVDYRVDSQVKVGMRERGFKEEGIREEVETRGRRGEPRGKGQEGQTEREHSTIRQRAVVGRASRHGARGVRRAGRPWDEEPAGTRQGHWSDELGGGRWGEHLKLGWRGSRAGGRPDGSSRSCLAGWGQHSDRRS